MVDKIKIIGWLLCICSMFRAGSSVAETEKSCTNCNNLKAGVSNCWESVQNIMTPEELDEMISFYELQVSNKQYICDSYMSVFDFYLQPEKKVLVPESEVLVSCQIERFKKERILVELMLKDRHLEQTKIALDQISSNLDIKSPLGLREASSLKEIRLLLKSAKKLTVYGEIHSGKGYVNKGEEEYKRDSVTILSPELIQEFAEFMSLSEFEHDSELSEEMRTGMARYGSVRHLRIEIDDIAYIYMYMTDMVICKNSKTYLLKKSNLSGGTDVISDTQKILLSKNKMTK